MTNIATAPPFKTKKSIREALALGSRWRMTHATLEGVITRSGTIVRASTTSRWIRWDDSDPAREGPLHVPVDSSAARHWVVTESGFYEDGPATAIDPTEVRWELLEPAPADVDHDELRRLARRPVRTNRYPGPCADCGGEVPAGAGRIEAVVRRWYVYHAPGECVPSSAATGA